MGAGESEMKVEGDLGSPGMSEIVLQGYSASVLPCAAALWSCSIMGEGAVSCHCDNRGRVPPLMKDACPNVACQSSAVLPFVFAEPSTGLLLASACMDGGSGVSDRVRGICLADFE